MSPVNYLSHLRAGDHTNKYLSLNSSCKFLAVYPVKFLGQIKVNVFIQE